MKPTRPKARRAPRIVLSVSSAVLCLVLAEMGFRLKALRDDHRLDRAWDRMGGVNELPEFSIVGLGQMTRISSNPRIIYELIPNLAVTFMGQPLRTDARGFRAMPPEADPPAPERTLIGIGDSIMFGWGVADDETYLSVLSRRVAADAGPRTWRFVNTAVPGYNTVMEVETLKAKGLALSPSVVLVHFVPNDLDLPNFIRVQSNIFDLRRSFLRDYFSRYHRYRHDGLDRLVDVPFDDAQGRYAADANDIPPAYRQMVGQPAFEAALRELADLRARHGFRIVMLCDLEAPAFVRELCAALAIDLVETGRSVRRRIRESVAHDIADAGLVLSADDPHPSAAGHALIAELLYGALDWDVASDTQHGDSETEPLKVEF